MQINRFANQSAEEKF